MRAIFLALFLFIGSVNSRVEYSVEQVYKIVDVDYGTKAVTRFGSIQEIEKVLIPTTIPSGRYSVSLSSLGDNIYQISGTDIAIEVSSYYYVNTYIRYVLDVAHYSISLYENDD